MDFHTGDDIGVVEECFHQSYSAFQGNGWMNGWD